MKELALHLLDIAENSIAAGASTVEITVEEDCLANRVRLSVQDDGRGMDAATLARVADPFVTSRTTRVAGLGIPFLKAAAEACNGGFHICSTLGGGTRIDAEFQRDHIDCMPLGDLAGTWLVLLVGCPTTRWLFHYRVNGETFSFDSAPILQELGEVPLTEPSILSFVQKMLREGISSLQPQAAGQAPLLPLASLTSLARKGHGQSARRAGDRGET